MCDLCNTLLLAIHQVSTALCCETFISSVSRCSSNETNAADALSKCDMGRFLNNMPEANITPERVPGSLLQWIENPVPDRKLGQRIVKEMSEGWSLVIYGNTQNKNV